MLVAVIALAAIACASSATGGGPRCSPHSPTHVARSITLPGRPMDLAVNGGTVWVAIAGAHDPRTGATLRGGKLVAVDSSSGRIMRTLDLPVDPTEIAVGFGAVWVIGAARERRYEGVLRVDPQSGRVLAVIRASHAYGSRIGATDTAIWVGGADVYAKGHSDQAGVRYVYKLDPRRNEVVRRVLLPHGMTVLDLEREGSSLWVSGWWGVARISDGGRILFQEGFRGAGWSLARVPGAVWVMLPWTGTPYERRQDRAHESRRLLRIDTTGHGPRVVPVELTRHPGGLAASAGTVWLGGGDGLARLDDVPGAPLVVPSEPRVQPTAMDPFPGGLWAVELESHRLVEVAC